MENTDKITGIIVAVVVGLILAGLFLPYLDFYTTYVNPDPTIQTLMRTFFPIFTIIGGGLAIYNIRRK